MRPYAVKTAEVLQSVAASMVKAHEGDGRAQDDLYEGAGAVDDRATLHALLEQRPEKKVLIVVLTSDRGLCGAFNTNINKATEREWRTKTDGGATVEFATIGKKGREYLQRRGAVIAKDFPGLYDGLDLSKARLVSAWLVPRFEKKEYDAVYLAYNEFKSAITQKVSLEPLLPLKRVERAAPPQGAVLPTTEFIYVPDQGALLERLVPMYVEITLLRALLESQASEFGARMTAMDAATRNAKEMIARLTLAYNRARQAAITKELMEIIGGAEALKE
jgi:F-type H+-transporting ATPase subunit gamma